MENFKILSTLVIVAFVFSSCAEKATTPLQSINSGPYPGTDYEKIEQALENSTYLRGQVATFQDLTRETCRKYNKNEDLAGQIKAFIEQSRKSENAEVGDFDSICQKGENTYVIFQAKGPAKLISLWKDQKTFEFFKDEKNQSAIYGSDNAVIFFPESLNGKNIVYISAKDGPIYYWAFYQLDNDSMQSVPIEECNLEFESGAKNSFIIADQSELRCTKEYRHY